LFGRAVPYNRNKEAIIMKKEINALKSIRNKCASAIDKNTLNKMDFIISELEKENKRVKKPDRLSQLSKILVVTNVLKFLAGFLGD
jgi:hypothetical protein